LKEIATKFEELRGFCHVIGAVNESHIPVINPFIDPTSYYGSKGFYLAILQGLVISKCRVLEF